MYQRRRRARLTVLTPLLIVVLLVTAAAPPAAFADLTQSFPIGVRPCDNIDAQFCTPEPVVALPTSGVLRAQFTTSTVSAECSPPELDVRLVVDGVERSQATLAVPGGSTGVLDFGPVASGVHRIGVRVGCPLGGSPSSWSGTLGLTVSGLSAADVKIAALNQTVSVSTLVSVPVPPPIVPAGLEATYTRTTTGLATLAAGTYDANPVGMPTPPPILPVGFVDLLLLGGLATDTIQARFVPPNPIVPPNPTLPTDPCSGCPTQPVPPPIVPPNPTRLVYFNGAAWAPVRTSGGAAVPASADKSFAVTFSNSSTPQVTQLTGTVFATVPSYGFVGFLAPVDNNGILNVARAGRAIPLKWRLYDLGNNPVSNMSPAVVQVGSVSLSCGSGTVANDAILDSEYATGGSALQNQGGGAYQFNWSTPAGYAGTCRQLRLDLGERNPDGMPFYRTANFQFTK
jgi:hypothetical protein